MAYEGKKHVNPKLQQCGLFIMKSHPYIGATPDNIFSCKCTSNCVNKYTVEYKCPNDISDDIYFDACSKTKFLEQKDGDIQLKRNHKYYTQVMGQLALTNCKESYFLVWFPNTKPFLEKITFDQTYWAKVLRNLVVFFKSYMQEVLLGIADICMCPVCDKPCMNKSNLNENERSKSCNSCLISYHMTCFTSNSELCQFCDDSGLVLI